MSDRVDFFDSSAALLPKPTLSRSSAQSPDPTRSRTWSFFLQDMVDVEDIPGSSKRKLPEYEQGASSSMFDREAECDDGSSDEFDEDDFDEPDLSDLIQEEIIQQSQDDGLQDTDEETVRVRTEIVYDVCNEVAPWLINEPRALSDDEIHRLATLSMDLFQRIQPTHRHFVMFFSALSTVARRQSGLPQPILDDRLAMPWECEAIQVAQDVLNNRPQPLLPPLLTPEEAWASSMLPTSPVTTPPTMK